MSDDPDIYAGTFAYDPADPEGYRSGVMYVGRAAGGRENSVRVYEVPPGQSICPYHYEYVEEWLVVLDGEVRLRAPAGERPLARGAIVCFAAGPEGAHKVTCEADRPARVMMFSSAHEPSVAVYPDSDKIGVWPGREDDHVILRRADGHVDYYEGEA
jgi:uncharacterized cupin superfamily protein